VVTCGFYTWIKLRGCDVDPQVPLILILKMKGTKPAPPAPICCHGTHRDTVRDWQVIRRTRRSLGYYAVSTGKWLPMFGRSLLPPPAGSRNPRRDTLFVQNVGKCLYQSTERNLPIRSLNFERKYSYCKRVRVGCQLKVGAVLGIQYISKVP